MALARALPARMAWSNSTASFHCSGWVSRRFLQPAFEVYGHPTHALLDTAANPWESRYACVSARVSPSSSSGKVLTAYFTPESLARWNSSEEIPTHIARLWVRLTRPIRPSSKTSAPRRRRASASRILIL